MRSVYADVLRRGMLAATHELLGDGHTSHDLTRAVRSGEVIRVRQGHYACPELSAAEREAARVGGRLTGMSGARHYGIWAPLAPDLEVAVKPHARGLRTRFDATKKLSTTTRPNYTAVAWRNEQAAGRTVLSPIWCIDEIARTQSAAIAFGATESALHLGYITLADVAALIAILPRSRRGRLDEARGASESGGESLFRFHASGFAPRMRQQVRILGVGFVDFLIGDRLVVEIDGAEFHTSAKKFEEDRRRDARLRALGYRVLRFSYKQVEGSWSVVAAAMAAALADGDHRAH